MWQTGSHSVATAQQQAVSSAVVPVSCVDLSQFGADVIHRVHQERTCRLDRAWHNSPSFDEQRFHPADQAVIQLHQQVIQV
jgi:hypothetical protein